jgi:predicted nuclease of predicted toxin-antitoxin system
MPKFLVDANLPYYFSLWNNDDYIHQFDINDAWPDRKIWSYAKEHQLTIITKDSDFSNKIMFHTPPPKVIHIRFGNLKMKPFFKRMAEVWPDVTRLNQDFKLVNVFIDRIEGIN